MDVAVIRVNPTPFAHTPHAGKSTKSRRCPGFASTGLVPQGLAACACVYKVAHLRADVDHVSSRPAEAVPRPRDAKATELLRPAVRRRVVLEGVEHGHVEPPARETSGALTTVPAQDKER